MSTANDRQIMSESQSVISRLSAEAAGLEAPMDGLNEALTFQLARMNQPVKIIHKDHESVTAFCINKVKKYHL
jgi:hypothetical protein